MVCRKVTSASKRHDTKLSYVNWVHQFCLSSFFTGLWTNQRVPGSVFCLWLFLRLKSYRVAGAVVFVVACWFFKSFVYNKSFNSLKDGSLSSVGFEWWVLVKGKQEHYYS